MIKLTPMMDMLHFDILLVAGIALIVLLLPFIVDAKESLDEQISSAARAYVKLALAVGAHDPDYIDAYFGPEEWKSEVEQQQLSLQEIAKNASSELKALQKLDISGLDPLSVLRHRHLVRQFESLLVRVQLLDGAKLSFDDESLALYDAVAPHQPASHFQKILDQLEGLLPGTGSLNDRYTIFKQNFQIPEDKIDPVFQAAVTECRKRTKQHMDLSENETFTIEYVKDKPWAGYNWFKGGGKSVIQLNVSLPVYIDNAIDLACHEGYPGHHVYNILREKELLEKRKWVEFSIYPLFSPLAFIAEGTANYGIDVAFPGNERVAFETSVLFPLSGLDPARAQDYYKVKALTDQLSYAVNEAARSYLDGEISREETIQWLRQYAMMPPERADNRMQFIEKYRTYVVNYNLGKDLVKDYIESKTENADAEKRWREFEKLILTPILPSDLR